MGREVGKGTGTLRDSLGLPGRKGGRDGDSLWPNRGGKEAGKSLVFCLGEEGMGREIWTLDSPGVDREGQSLV
jgi:hypothetical protein